jgi:DNA-binding response OmpR family regulator
VSYKSPSTVIVITKSKDIKKVFFETRHKFPEVNICILKSSPIPEEIRCVQIIFVHIEISEVAIKEIQEIKRNSIAIPIFAIIQLNKEVLNSDMIKLLVANGVELIIKQPIDQNTIEFILFKYLFVFRDRVQNYNLKKYNGLYLNEECHYAILNECKIFLTPIETLILSILMKKDVVLDCEDIKNLLKDKMDKKYKSESIRICIQRLRDKFKESTGLNIIGNKYGRGYYICI